jgi:alkylhydroperoxidase family enzyme
MRGRPVVEPRTSCPGFGVALRAIGPFLIPKNRLNFDFRNVTMPTVSEFKTPEVSVPSRISPVQPPYEGDVGGQLEAMMPRGVPPILLFRTFVKNLAMAKAMGSWGSYELSKRLSLSLRDREIVIDRTCARCRCEYEWGVHVAFFADRVGLTAEQVSSLTHGESSDPCWVNQRDQVLIDVADALHDGSRILDGLWERLSGELTEAEILDLLMLCGWYHAISFAANGIELSLEDGAPRFEDVLAISASSSRRTGGLDYWKLLPSQPPEGVR